MATRLPRSNSGEHRARKRQKTPSTLSAVHTGTATGTSLTPDQVAALSPAKIAQLLADLQSKVERTESRLEKVQEERNQYKAQSQKTAKPTKRKKAAASSLLSLPAKNFERLPDLSSEEKKNVLNEIHQTHSDEKEKGIARSNKGLQVLLWELGSNYCLQKHQFLGVRAIARVPDDFPGCSFPNTDHTVSFEKIRETLSSARLRQNNERGLIMADTMGVGKTVQAVAACILRNAVAVEKKKPKRPTLIIAPSKAVLSQWHETLIKAGVDKMNIYSLVTKRSKPLGGDLFVLCTIYDLQTEVRNWFGGHTSALFSEASPKHLKVLRNQYRANKGQERNKYNKLGDCKTLSVNECIRQCLKKRANSWAYRTVIVDEAHFLRTPATYWGIGAGLVGIHTERMILLSGTPYNNRLQDIATLVMFMNPSDPSARVEWWQKATKCGAAQQVIRQIEDWSKENLLRRGKDVIASQLHKKSIVHRPIVPAESEMSSYCVYECKIMSALKQMGKAFKNGDRSPKEKKKCLLRLMAATQHAMLALIHPVLPNGGRGLSILVSPSRGRLESAKKQQEKPNICACCKRRKGRKKARKDVEDPDEIGVDYLMGVEGWDAGTEDELEEQSVEDEKLTDETDYEEPNTDDGEVVESEEGQKQKNDEWVPVDQAESLDIHDHDHDLDLDEWEDEKECDKSDEEYLDADGTETDGDEHDLDDRFHSDDDESEGDEESISDDDEDDSFDGSAEATCKGSGEIMPIPTELCAIGQMGIRHFACESCLESLEQCPKCAELISTLEESRSDNKKDELGGSGVSAANQFDASKDMDEHEAPRGRIYCPEIFGGFRPSAKLQAICSDFEAVPKEDKVLIVSFFKGSLDLLERMFSEIYPKVEVARFDGDISDEERANVLQTFKYKASCRILLMTVQTGGVGLNLVEANHVWFVNRWWNPMVLEQCEDRVYRIGQKKDVTIRYYDARETIDVVMAEINETKATNAAIVLADGPALSKNPSFNETSGLMFQSIRALQGAREAKQSATPSPPTQQSPPGPATEDSSLIPVSDPVLDAVVETVHEKVVSLPDTGDSGSPDPSDNSILLVHQASNGLDSREANKEIEAPLLPQAQKGTLQDGKTGSTPIDLCSSDLDAADDI
ncbi:annealing helicase and endonuclease ZRANB3 [Seminavis robusta]|uniref:Annealing helicase and endonuclease ZRANB3 n=1 Tax=Seminavis robusta TaxID=568900 RepID=A0A9N8HNH9_9STRA|nr:annealing helicase and endonuclease ZRANB3 [Seminavis robusta]|eukprot:Sro996_g229300.1 annealing helicase and endonuclease ZRANB3 (1134) ;mRNA; f:21682-25534